MEKRENDLHIDFSSNGIKTICYVNRWCKLLNWMWCVVVFDERIELLVKPSSRTMNINHKIYLEWIFVFGSSHVSCGRYIRKVFVNRKYGSKLPTKWELNRFDFAIKLQCNMLLVRIIGSRFISIFINTKRRKEPFHWACRSPWGWICVYGKVVTKYTTTI